MTPPTISAADLEVVLRGHRDGVHARCVALLVLRGGLDFRTALRKYGIPKSTLYSAKCSLESDFIGRDERLKCGLKANVSQHSKDDDDILPDRIMQFAKAGYF